MSLISGKAECVLAWPHVDSLLRKVCALSEDTLALGEKSAFSLKFPG